MPVCGQPFLSLSFACPRVQHEWNQTACAPLCLGSLAQSDISEVHPCCSHTGSLFFFVAEEYSMV